MDFFNAPRTLLKKNQLLVLGKLLSAERNGKVTETLNGAYFEFDKDGLMTTNLLGREESTPFDFNEQLGQILQIGNNNLLFTITSIEDNALNLQTSIQDNPFSLKLRKIEDH